MQMVAFIHNQSDAQQAIGLLNGAGIEAHSIETRMRYYSRDDGYRIMVSDENLENAQKVIFERLPSLRPTESEIIASSIIQSDWGWLKYVVVVFVVFLIYCAVFFKG
jgi:hypothetical protein